jgi:hypothetical protein
VTTRSQQFNNMRYNVCQKRISKSVTIGKTEKNKRIIGQIIVGKNDNIFHIKPLMPTIIDFKKVIGLVDLGSQFDIFCQHLVVNLKMVGYYT